MMDFPKTYGEMEARFSKDEDCLEYLRQMRWPTGFVCPRCGDEKVWMTKRGLQMCGGCGYQVSVCSGTVFQGSHLPLKTWFRAMWHMTSQKNGISALGLQRVLGLGSYKTAWTLLHKLRRAMVRPGRDRLSGTVEVDETYLGAKETGVIGRLTHKKALIIVAAEEEGTRIGRIRMRRIPDLRKKTLHGFIADAVELGGTVKTDGWRGYLGMDGYVHDRQIQSEQPQKDDYLMPRVHRVVSLLKRWLLGTHQGAVKHEHIDDYLNEFTFRFNRRTSASRGKLFYRLVQIAVQVDPAPFRTLVAPQHLVGTGVK